ncbi:MAG: DUF86 domain-containing protein [Magnetococcales bacterium]|nr:DUF86 domain-containing protein [Magnetococcales bacterium]
MNKDSVYLEHMVICLQKISEYVAGGRADFFRSSLIQDAVLRNLQIMAESSQKLSSDLKQANPLVDWRTLSGFRNVLAHDYLGIDLEIIWQVVEKRVPGLMKAIRNIQVAKEDVP